MMGRGGRFGLGLGVSLASCVAASFAVAAPQRRDQGPLFTQVDTGQAAAASARALAAQGQCAKALDLFDQALRSTIDMSIRRDRGLCHEALGHPFPAMDDYRAYLVWKPDAPDSANIRARLEALQIQTGVAGPAPAVADDPEAVPTEPALIDDSTTPGTSDDGKRKATVKKTYDEEEDSYRAYDEAVSSPLRRGHGAILGVYSDFRDLYSPGSSIPNIEVGASIRYGFDGYNSLYGQLGYVDYTPSGGTASGGLALGLGYELRIRLDEMATHNFLLGALLEYQRIESSVSEGSLLAEGTANLLVPEVKVGYRLVLGHGFGIELTGDLAIPIYLASTPVVANYPEFGGSLAVLLAF